MALKENRKLALAYLERGNSFFGSAIEELSGAFPKAVQPRIA